MQARLLIVDRDAQYARWLGAHIGAACPDVQVETRDLDRFTRDHEELTRTSCDVVILGASFGTNPDDPAAEGLQWLQRLHGRPGFPPVMAVADDGNELTAVRAMQLGAVDYLPKRLITPERLATAVRGVLTALEQATATQLDALAALAADGAAVVEGQGDGKGNGEGDDSLAELKRDLIPGYTLQEVLGESEKAVVYLARSERLQRDVALKVCRHVYDPSDSGSALGREYAAIASLRHRAIVSIFDYGVHDGREYLAMEYFPRGDLKSRLHQGVSPHDALGYVLQVAMALRVVHDAGLLHRDLKPANVMLREDDSVVLIDFGLARNVDGTGGSTRTGVLRGSPYYMSPEQVLGQPLDARTDLYSLGIICYELLTGDKPFKGDTAMELLQQHVDAPIPRLSADLARYQPLLDGLLAKSPEARPQSASAVMAAVAAASATESAEPATAA